MGSNSITVSAIESWKKIQTQLKDLLLRDLQLPSDIGKYLSSFFNPIVVVVFIFIL